MNKKQTTAPSQPAPQTPQTPQTQQNPLIAEVNKIVTDVVQSSGEKKIPRSAAATDVKEYQFTNEDKKTTTSIVVYLPFIFIRDHKALIPKIVNEIQKRRNQHAFVISKRTVINKNADFKQMIPRNRTLTSVYDSVLEDLLNPGLIIGKRIRYRLNGSQLVKIFLSEESRAFLESKTSLIAQLYFALTNRKVAFEFRPETSHIQIPKAKIPAKKPASKPKA